jgi:4-amino-4-deoxy-L-arabinose transferase-like glycosyltransferase
MSKARIMRMVQILRMIWPALLFSGAVAAITWPGFMSFDSLVAYREATSGIQSPMWPPAHAYLMWLSLKAFGGVGAILLFQLLAVSVAAVIIFHRLAPRHRLRLTFAFAAILVVFPTLIGTLVIHLHDGLACAFALSSVALWLAAPRPWGAVGALAAIGASAALRFNALALVAPVLVLILIWRDAENPIRRRWVLWAFTAVLLAGAWASTVWRLPDFHRLPRMNLVSFTQEFDLIGISACAGKDYLPPAATAGRPISGAELRAAYSPVGFLESITPRPGIRRIYWIDTDPSTPPEWTGPDAGTGSLLPAWVAALRAQPLCYLSHRLKVTLALLGLPHPYLPTHPGGIDPNKYGLQLANPAGARSFIDYVVVMNVLPITNAAWFFLICPIVLLARTPGSPKSRLALWAIYLGSLLYAGTFVLTAPVSEARYLVPSEIFCVVVTLCASVVPRDRTRTKPALP